MITPWLVGAPKLWSREPSGLRRTRASTGLPPTGMVPATTNCPLGSAASPPTNSGRVALGARSRVTTPGRRPVVASSGPKPVAGSVSSWPLGRYRASSQAECVDVPLEPATTSLWSAACITIPATRTSVPVNGVVTRPPAPKLGSSPPLKTVRSSSGSRRRRSCVYGRPGLALRRRKWFRNMAGGSSHGTACVIMATATSPARRPGAGAVSGR